MPFGDGTGPIGRGLRNRRDKVTGIGKGRMGGSNPGAGPEGYCVCPQCGEKVAHRIGTPCYNMTCPKCGTRMTRG